MAFDVLVLLDWGMVQVDRVCGHLVAPVLGLAGEMFVLNGTVFGMVGGVFRPEGVVFGLVCGMFRLTTPGVFGRGDLVLAGPVIYMVSALVGMVGTGNDLVDIVLD